MEKNRVPFYSTTEKEVSYPDRATMRENLISTAAFRAGHMESMCSIAVGGTVEDEDDLANLCAYLATKWEQESPDTSYDEFIESALVDRYGG